MRTIVSTLIAALLCLAPVGCANSVRTLAKASTGRLEPPNVPPREQTAAEITDASSPAAPLEEPTREEAFQRVLGDLQAIGRQDPAAQQRLLSRLEKADPAHWSLMVERAQSTLSYQRQMAEREVPVDPESKVLPASSKQPYVDDQVHPPAATHTDLHSQQPPLKQSAQHPPKRVDSAIQQTSAVTELPVERVAETDSLYPTTPHAEIAIGEQAEPALCPQCAAGDYEAALQRAIDLLTQQLSEQPQSVGEAYHHVRLRLLQLAAGDLDQAAAAPAGLSASEQKFWSNQVLALSTLLDHQTQPEVRRRAAAGSLHLCRASEALQQIGSLTLSNLEFCQEVYGFGAYDKLPAAKFRPGQEVKVYVEVDNYKSVETEQGMHTSLATSYEVLDQHGGRVDGGEVPVVIDYCARRRRDFHIQYGITLPEGIYPGQYLLKLTITDQLGDKIGHGALDFEIASSQR